MNQWMFIFDGFGIHYERKDDIARGSAIDYGSAPQISEGFEVIDNDGENTIFQPYLVKFMCSRAFDDLMDNSDVA